MKYFKFWAKSTVRIKVNDTQKDISILMGSNLSKDDALKKATEQAKVIEDRISSGQPANEYESPIKEHVERIIDDANIITVCRYGAKILNTSQYTVLDLDDYPINFLDIFKPLHKLSKKERIIYKFEERLKKHPELGSDFRIYETTKGIRIIGKKYLNPEGNLHSTLMRKFYVDWLYIILSEKQKCYRARISPKPFRMKMKTIKIRSPLDCETMEYAQWEKEYTSTSKRYSVVRLVKTLGKDFSKERVIQLHDDACNCHKGLRLA